MPVFREYSNANVDLPDPFGPPTMISFGASMQFHFGANNGKDHAALRVDFPIENARKSCIVLLFDGLQRQDHLIKVSVYQYFRFNARFYGMESLGQFADRPHNLVAHDLNGEARAMRSEQLEPRYSQPAISRKTV